jgi:hypothetical protein
MSATVCQIRHALHAAYQAAQEHMTVAIKSVYNKTNGVEPQVCAALVRETSGKPQEILAALPLEFEPLIPGYRLKCSMAITWPRPSIAWRNCGGIRHASWCWMSSLVKTHTPQNARC